MTAESKKEEIHVPKPVFLTKEEAREMKENLARKNFGMSLDEFFEAWKAGEFDNDRERHGEVISLAMMVPEAWETWKPDARQNAR
ncbi:MAG: hypothetical protein OXC95_11405 [Dehalococcoidia bacterium]|nr:hypothetical protein [Dehalococcoidia bacterium]